MKCDLVMRNAVQEDIPVILSLINELAEYEKLQSEARANEQDLFFALFQEHTAEAILAEYDSQIAGFALFFHNFSTFAGKKGLYLEDLYVRPQHRGLGIGKALLIHLAGIAKQRNCARFEWAVLDWNTPAISFYQSLGATPMHEWTIFRVSGASLSDLADQSSKK